MDIKSKIWWIQADTNNTDFILQLELEKFDEYLTLIDKHITDISFQDYTYLNEKCLSVIEDTTNIDKTKRFFYYQCDMSKFFAYIKEIKKRN